MRRVNLLWAAPVLATAVFGSVFSRCSGGPEVDEPMRWKNALDVPVNYSVPVGDTFYNEVYRIVNQGIVDAVPELKSDGQDSLTSIILESDIVGNMMDDDFEDQLLEFMKSDTSVQKLLEKNNLKPDSVAAAVAEQTGSFKEQVTSTFDDNGPFQFSLDPMTIPALDIEVLSNMDNPAVDPKFKLINKTPLGFTLYMLFFEERNLPFINALSDSAFVKFIEGLDNRDTVSGYINFFYDEKSGKKVLEIKKDGTVQAPPLSPAMKEKLGRFIFGAEPLVWKWMAIVEGKAKDVLDALGDKQEYRIDAELSIGIKGTMSF